MDDLHHFCCCSSSLSLFRGSSTIISHDSLGLGQNLGPVVNTKNTAAIESGHWRSSFLHFKWDVANDVILFQFMVGFHSFWMVLIRPQVWWSSSMVPSYPQLLLQHLRQGLYDLIFQHREVLRRFSGPGVETWARLISTWVLLEKESISRLRQR